MFPTEIHGRLCDNPKEHLRDIVIVANNQLATLDFSNLRMRAGRKFEIQFSISVFSCPH